MAAYMALAEVEEDKYTEDGTTDYRNNPAIRNRTGTWKACPYILVTTVTNLYGTCSVTPLLGAFLADSYLGRYWTIAASSIVYVFGMAILALSASVHGLKPLCDDKHVCHPTSMQIAVFYVGLYLMALVLIWIQTNVSWSWGFGIPAAAMAVAVVSFFSGTRLYRNVRPGGSPFTRIFQVIVASVRKSRVEVPKNKSLLYETTAEEESVIKGSRKLDHTNKLSFFDKAAVVTQSDKIDDSVSPWRLCTVTQIEELKCIIGLLPILASGIIFYAAYSQMSTLFVLQGNTMDLHMGTSFEIPSASLSLFNIVSVISCVVVYDRVIIPSAKRITGHKNGFSQLQRIGIGLALLIFAMLCAGTLELMRLKMVKKHNYYELQHVPMSVFWQVPQYFIIGCAEVFTCIGQLEFFYEQAPDAMRSLCSALSLTTSALGNYLSTLLVSIVTDVSTRNGGAGWIPDNLNYGHLDYFFWMLALLSAVNFGVFFLVAKHYPYKKVEPVFHY
ncbi:hypothetical protein AgCh_026934 [Apium graveolens]